MVCRVSVEARGRPVSLLRSGAVRPHEGVAMTVHVGEFIESGERLWFACRICRRCLDLLGWASPCCGEPK